MSVSVCRSVSTVGVEEVLSARLLIYLYWVMFYTGVKTTVCVCVWETPARWWVEHVLPVCTSPFHRKKEMHHHIYWARRQPHSQPSSQQSALHTLSDDIPHRAPFKPSQEIQVMSFLNNFCCCVNINVRDRVSLLYSSFFSRLTWNIFYKSILL